MMLRVTVNKLNVRSAPVADFANKSTVVGIVHKGYTFEGREAMNVSVPGKWFQDRDGYYYWGDGLAIVTEEAAHVECPPWMLNLKLPSIWKHATGKNVGVAVIDTGIRINADIAYNKTRFYMYENAAGLDDTSGHGTHCAGLIGARNKNERIVGTAPDCNLYVCKISEGASLTEAETMRYAEAINWCADQNGVHVISISWGSFINDKTILSHIREAINRAVQRNKIVVCAMGDASRFNDPGPLYPVSLDNTIGVGSIPVDPLLYPYINSSLTTLLEGKDIPSYDLNGSIITMSGTSQSNAIVAGIVALLIDKKRGTYTPAEIKAIVANASLMKTIKGIQLPVLSGDLLLQYFQSSQPPIA